MIGVDLGKRIAEQICGLRLSSGVVQTANCRSQRGYQRSRPKSTRVAWMESAA